MRLLVLLLRLLQLDLIDFDAELLVGEGGVDAECVGDGDVAGFGRFGEDAVSAAGHGLEGAIEFAVGCWGEARKLVWQRICKAGAVEEESCKEAGHT